MAIVFLIGRIIFGGYFLVNAWSHFRHLESLAGYAGSKNVPSPKLAVGVTGLLLLIGGLGVLLGVYVTYALVALAIFLIPVTFTMHAYWKETDPNQKMNERIAFMKNLALLGAVLMLFAISEPWLYSL